MSLRVTRLETADSLEATAWLRAALSRFAGSVAAFVPAHFAAYARILHPFGNPADVTLHGLAALPWHALAGRAVEDPIDAETFALRGMPNAQSPTGTLPRATIELLIATLAASTSTPDACFFALWTGFGDSIVSHDVVPTLELPHRRYHVFAGTVEDARSNYSASGFGHQSANLWWPADHAWCVATEIDAAWTYVAGDSALVERLLSQPGLDISATVSEAPW